MDTLTARYQQELERTALTVRGHVARAWSALPDYHDGSKTVFLDSVLPVVRAGQERAVSLTSVYMSERAGLANPVPLPLDLLTGAGTRNGFPPKDVYARVFTTLYTSIEKIGYAKAYEKALARLESMADMDVAMSARNASMAFATASGAVSAFKRVAAPGCCAFCDEIDGALVKSDEAAPLHNNCRCTVEPASDEEIAKGKFIDVGSVVGATRIEEHGEMGPMITDKDYHWTPVGDASKWDEYRAAAERYKAANEEAYTKWMESMTPAQQAFYRGE
jgi:hypothetical protein